jgi:hypothetical protein
LSEPTPLPTSAVSAQPGDVLVTNDAGELIATQPGPIWVLISGVDEHGLIAEHEVTLLSQPDATAVSENTIHTGTAVGVYQIRQTGPQNLQRFYSIQSPTGQTGWISDYYVRRVAYLFNDQGTHVAIYDSPAENEIASFANITPIVILSPLSAWWKVQSTDGSLTGWVLSTFVKESPEPEFLLNQQHDHS